MKCSKCKFESKDGSKFCEQCGSALNNTTEISNDKSNPNCTTEQTSVINQSKASGVTMAFCDKCGSTLKGNSKFCDTCGEKIKETINNSTLSQKKSLEKTKNPQSRVKLIILAIFGVVLVAAIVYVVSLYITNKTKSTNGINGVANNATYINELIIKDINTYSGAAYSFTINEFIDKYNQIRKKADVSDNDKTLGQFKYSDLYEPTHTSLKGIPVTVYKLNVSSAELINRASPNEVLDYGDIFIEIWLLKESNKIVKISVEANTLNKISIFNDKSLMEEFKKSDTYLFMESASSIIAEMLYIVPSNSNSLSIAEFTKKINTPPQTILHDHLIAVRGNNENKMQTIFIPYDKEKNPYVYTITKESIDKFNNQNNTTQATTQTTTTQSPSYSRLEQMVLDGNQRYYTKEELIICSDYELSILRNGLYALSGKRFTQNQEVINFFNNCDWYKPDTTDDGTVKSRWNNYQRSNLETIVRWEKGN